MSSWVFHGNFKNVSRVIQRIVMEMSSVSQKLQSVLRKFHGCFREISKVFQECFTRDSRRFQKPLSAGLRESFNKVSRIFHRSFKEVSRKVSKCLVEFKALVSVFQCCYVFESLSLHITHRSYPSRRRAC